MNHTSNTPIEENDLWLLLIICKVTQMRNRQSMLILEIKHENFIKKD
jgi:hypothetical protein